jgi:hypothetical protein
MATKKQKRAELEAKRIREAEETRLQGLAALERDRKQRALRAQAIKEKAEAENKRLEAVLAAAKMNAMAGITHSKDD